MPAVAPQGQRLHILKRQERVGAGEMRDILVRARERMDLAILKAARNKNLAKSVLLRDQLWAKLSAEYARMGGNLNGWMESRTKAVAREWRKLGIADLPAGSYDQDWSQFSRKYLRDVAELASPVNAPKLAAVNAAVGTMAEQDIGVLRAAVVQVNRLAAATGMTGREIQKELLSVVTSSSPAWAFIDSAGKKWNPKSYFSMLNRTTSANVSRNVTMNVAAEAGFDLHIIEGGVVSNSHPGCVEWAGRIVSASGASDTHPSLEAAVSDGLFHPNCRHYLAPVTNEARGERREVELQERKATQQKKIAAEEKAEAEKKAAAAAQAKAKKQAKAKPAPRAKAAPRAKPAAIRDAATVGEASEIAKARGWDVRHADDTSIDFANGVNQSLDAAEKMGVPVERVIWNTAALADTYQGMPTASSFLGKPNVTLNNRKNWKAVQAQHAVDGKPTTVPAALGGTREAAPWHSTTNPHHTIVHETAHQIHWAELGAVKGQGHAVDNWQVKHFSAEHMLARNAGHVVSEYAQASPLEFVAEVYAKAKATKWKPTKDVADLYATLHGPVL